MGEQQSELRAVTDWSRGATSGLVWAHQAQTELWLHGGASLSLEAWAGDSVLRPGRKGWVSFSSGVFWACWVSGFLFTLS